MAATRSRGGARGGGAGRVGSPGGRGRRKSATFGSFLEPVLGRLQALARRLGRVLLARGPLILVGTGTLFLVLMVAFLYFVPLPPPVVPVATRVLDRNGELVGSLFSQNRIPVPLSQMPETLKQGFVALEDERFYEHHGLDPIGIIRAAVRNVRAGEIVEGGSTITQQVARILYLTQEVTFTRKIVEALLALKLERAFTKQELLELYLNGLYLGSGTFGVEVAAQTYFGKSVGELDLPETAMIAGLAANPEGFSPFNRPERALSRRNLVLDFWAEKGVITAEAAARAKEEPVALATVGPPEQVGRYFMDYIVTLIKEAQAQGARLPSLGDLYVGGYRIYTTLDVRMQRAADEAVDKWMPAGEKNAAGVTQPQVGLVAMDPANGYILAMVGGRSFAETQLNRAVPPGEIGDGMRRQPGSAFKPFLYAAVLDSGFPLISEQVCEPVEFPSGSGRPYVPTDYGSRQYHYAALTIREAVRISDNVVAVKWAARIGAQKEKQFAQRMGIDSPLTNDLSLALGSSEVSVLEMARVYSTMANGGFRVQPQALLRVEDRFGRVIYDPGRAPRGLAPERALDERVAFLMNELLKEPFKSGGTAAHLLRFFSRPAGGKTGTTDSQHDAWFVGYTPQISCAVWVGNDQPSPLPGYGGTLAGPVWANFMAAAHEGLRVVDFPEPAGIVRLEVCAETGLLPNPTCPRVEELFIEGTEPRQRHRQFHIPAPDGDRTSLPDPGLTTGELPEYVEHWEGVEEASD